MCRIMVVLALCVFLFPAAEETVAPSFSTKDVSGNLVDSKTLLESGPVILWFWNSCCGLKKQQLKALKDIYSQYNSQGLEIIAVNEDEPKKDAQVNKAIKVHRIPFRVIMDPEGELMRRFHALAVPQIYVIARDGTIRYSKSGYMSGDNKELFKTVSGLFENKK
jgi:peroxiredoxin